MGKFNQVDLNRQKIQLLLDSEKYIGDITSKGFILKRNFGIRRLPIYGYLEGNTYRLQIKNEVLHEILLWVSLFMMSSLFVFAIFHFIYEIALFCVVFILLLYLMNRQRKKDEIRLFYETLEDLENSESLP